jgi:hypothetical protein
MTLPLSKQNENEDGSAMNAPLFFAASLLFAPVPDKENFAKVPADGIYLVHEKGVGPIVTRNDSGDQLVLGERLATNFGAAAIDAGNNSNSLFLLALTGAGPLPQAQLGGSTALLIGGRCFMIYSRSDPKQNGTLNINSFIYGEESVKAVATALKAGPVLRKHPGHRFVVTFEPDKKSYRRGAPITLTMKIKNVGGETMCFIDGGRQRGPRDNQFGFTAMRRSGSGKAITDTGDPTNFGGIGSYQLLKAGDVFQKKVSLDDWFQFKDDDNYLITATYRFELYDPNGKINHVIWDDFATGECTVRVMATK